MPPFLFLLACAPPHADERAASVPCASGDIRDDAGACVPAACGTAEFAVADADVFLRPGDDASAVLTSMRGGTIALAAGQYETTLAFGADADGVNVVGRCRELVVVDATGGSGGTPAAAFSSLASHHFSLAGVTLTGAPRGGVFVESAEVDLTRVAISGNAGHGLEVGAAGLVTVDDVLISDTAASRSGDALGIWMTEGGVLQGVGLTITRAVDSGIRTKGATVNLSGLSIADTQPTDEGLFGFGAYLSGGSDVTLAHASFTDNIGAGLAFGDDGTTARLSDIVITGTRMPPPQGGDAIALYVLNGASVTASGVRLRENAQSGIVSQGSTIELDDTDISGQHVEAKADAFAVEVWAGGRLSARDIRIHDGTGIAFAASDASVLDVTGCDVRDLSASLRGAPGRGTELAGGAMVQLSNCTFTRTNESGILIHDVGTEVTLDHVTIVDPQPHDWDGIGGIGLQVEGGATVTANDLTIRGARNYAVGVAGGGTSVVIDGMTATGIRPDESGLGGVGLLVASGGALDVHDAALTDLERFGVEVSGNSTLHLSDSVISHVRPDTLGFNGGGLLVLGGSQVDVERSRFVDLTSIGLIAREADTVLTADDIVINGIATSDFGFGNGIEVSEGATFAVSRCTVTGAAGAGLAVTGAGTTATVDRCTLLDTRPDGRGSSGHISVGDGATLRGHALTIDGGAGVGVVVSEAGTQVEIDTMRVSRIGASPMYTDGFGVACQRGGAATLTHLTVSEVDGPGLAALDGGQLRCTSCAIDANASVGVAAIDGQLALTDTTITNTRPGRALPGGIGVLARSLVGDTTVELSRVQISGNALAAVWDEGARDVVLRDSTISGGVGVEVREGLYAHGNAIFARGVDGDERRLAVTRGAVTGASVGVLLEGATAEIDGAVWLENAVDVATQQCGELPPPTDLTGATVELCPASERLTFPMDYDIFLPEPAASSE